MSYQLKLHTTIHDWLTELRVTEPEVAGLVGEAVLAMLEAGASLGPPLVVPLETVLRPPADPRAFLDYSYQRQLEAMTKVRRSVADVATARKRVELQVAQLEHGAGQAAIQEQLTDLRHQLGVLLSEEERITVASQRLQAKIDSFRTRKETIKATHTAEEASRRVRDVFASLGDDTIELDMTSPDPGFSEDAHRASAAADLVLEEISELIQTLNGPGLADEDAIVAPPGLLELRPGVPDRMPVGLLFVVEPDAVVLAAAAPSGAFLSYDAESFLDEFFPGAETEVEIGAAALTARHRAYTPSPRPASGSV